MESSFTQVIDDRLIADVRALLSVRVRLRVSEVVKRHPWYFGGGSTRTLTVSGPAGAIAQARAELRAFLFDDEARQAW